MQDPESKQSIDRLLEQLSEVLCEERSALLCMDAVRIESMAALKASLSDALTACRDELSPGQRTKLAAIHGRVQQNMILLAHARDFLANALGLSENRLPLAKKLHLPAVETGRLSVRG